MKGEVTFKNNTGGILFVRLINTGLPKPGDEEPMKSNLDLQVHYTDMEGNRISPGEISQGRDLIAVYRAYNPGTSGHLENIALTTIFPSGWEIHNERLFSTSSVSYPFTYQDIRDDRVMTYFSLPVNQSKTFTVRLNAAYNGRYYLPAVKAEEMYKREVQVVIPGSWIVVPAAQ